MALRYVDLAAEVAASSHNIGPAKAGPSGTRKPHEYGGFDPDQANDASPRLADLFTTPEQRTETTT